MSVWGVRNVKELSDQELLNLLRAFVEKTKDQTGVITAMAEAILRLATKAQS